MLELFVPELRLLPSQWAYDPASQTLFTGDLFTWVWYPDPLGPWLLADDSTVDPTTPERVADSLLLGRYWWLAGADTTSIRENLAEIFENRVVTTIAPDHGPVLSGDAVTRHRAFLDDFLERAPSLVSLGVEAGAWPAGGTR
jgi:hypothetical protein